MKLAAIDIGSNALRLLIVRVIPGQDPDAFKKVEFIRIPLRLGDDVFTEGTIGKEKKELFTMAIQAFKVIMDIHKVDDYLACATSAMREAKNGKEITRGIQKRFGVEIAIISGEEESRIILQSVMQSAPHKGNYINIDVGGGSTEITVIHNGEARESRSFPVGTVRLMDGKVKKDTWEEMEKWVKKQTTSLKNIKALGTGGNISRLYRMGTAVQKEGYLPVAELQKMYNDIVSLSIPDRINQLRMNPDRADVIEHAARIYLQIMKWGKVDEILAPQAGLKEGLIIELMRKQDLLAKK